MGQLLCLEACYGWAYFDLGCLNFLTDLFFVSVCLGGANDPLVGSTHGTATFALLLHKGVAVVAGLLTIRGYRYLLVRAVASDNDRACGLLRRLQSGLITKKHEAQQITAELAAIVRLMRSAEARPSCATCGQLLSLLVPDAMRLLYWQPVDAHRRRVGLLFCA